MSDTIGHLNRIHFLRVKLTMTDAFDKLKELLHTHQTLTNEQVAAMEAEHGPMTDEEKMWLESEKLKLQRQDDVTITMDQYLAATQVLDSAEEGSAAYDEALAIVERFESGM
jgi:hypothetical protein